MMDDNVNGDSAMINTLSLMYPIMVSITHLSFMTGFESYSKCNVESVCTFIVVLSKRNGIRSGIVVYNIRFAIKVGFNPHGNLDQEANPEEWG